jgi:hypothetical protein
MGLTAGTILIVLGLAVPTMLVLALVWDQERRRSFARLKFGRLAQDNRGLKLALNKTPAGSLPLAFANEHERQEFLELAGALAANGTLLDWLRLGSKPPLDAGARLLGVNERDAIALRQAVADWTAQGILAVLERVKVRFTHIADMERVWSASAGEVNLRPVIDQAMWVFEPEILVTESGQAVSSTATLARATTDLSFDPSRSGQDTGGKILVEMRDVRATVGSEDQLQAWNDVRELMKAGAIRERDAVDVYVIGGSVDDLDGNPRIEGRNRNVRITSCDYGQVIGRAKRLTLGLYDDLVEAPFLRQYRADAEAAALAEIERTRFAQQQQRLSAELDDQEDRQDDHGYHAADSHAHDEEQDDGHDAPEPRDGGRDGHGPHSPLQKKGQQPAPQGGGGHGQTRLAAIAPPAPIKPPRRFLRNAAQ